jgi:hypothetical protein
MYVGINVKYQLFLLHFNRSWIFSTYKVVQIWPGQTVTCLHTISPGHIWTNLYFLKNLKIWISWKSLQWEPSCSMRTDRQLDTTKLIVAFRNFANAPKNVSGHPATVVVRFRLQHLPTSTIHEVNQLTTVTSTRIQTFYTKLCGIYSHTAPCFTKSCVKHGKIRI